MESGNNIKEENELEAEEQVLLVSDDGSIVIDENTTFVDDEGNPVIVNRQAEGENIEFIFQGENDATDTTEKIYANDSQEHDSSEQEDSPTASNDFLEVTTETEQEENIEAAEKLHASSEQGDGSTASNDFLEVTIKTEQEENIEAEDENIDTAEKLYDSSEQGNSSTAPNDLLEVSMQTEQEENIETAAKLHASPEQEDSLTVSNDLTEAAKKSEEEQNSTEQDGQFKFNKISKSTSATAISFLKRKKQASSNETASICKSVIVIENNAANINNNKPIKVRTDIPEGTIIDHLTCQYCIKKFATERKKIKHCSDVHKVYTGNTNSNIKCVECNFSFLKVKKLVDHLQCKHGLKMNVQELSFTNMKEFHQWKSTIERQELSRYLRTTVKRKPLFCYHYFVCHRSGKSRFERRKGTRMPKRDGSLKLGLMCTSSIRIKEYPDTVQVSFCPHHYGHGKETNYRKLTATEQSAIQETISNGVSYENILGDMHEDTANFGVGIIKSMDIKILKKAFDTEESIPGCLSDADSLNSWVRACTQMEDSPVLYYSQEDNKILLVIMTEFQKNILLSSDKQILSIDNALRQRGSRFYLTYLMALDERETAFPVAFCISSTVDKSVVQQFLISIRDSTGPLSCSYFMSDSDIFYYEAWQEVMLNNSIWLWSKWFVDSTFLNKLHQAKLPIAVRSDFYKRLKSVSECRSLDVFETMFKNFTADLCAEPAMRNVAKLMLDMYSNSKETWAYCYHKDLKLSSVRQLETLHRTMKYCCREGRKKRLDKFIFVMLKYVRFKMLDRLNCMLDEEKISLVVKAINAHHDSGFEIPTDRINSLGDKIWVISSENNEGSVYVHREYDSCPDFCSLKCSECDTCVHMFSCSCIRNMIYADLCPHIHAVVWKFLTPHFSPLPSPVHNSCDDIDNDDTEGSSAQNQPELFDTALKMTHDVFKKIRSSKSELKESTLVEINNRLKELMDICSSKVVPDSPLNSNNELSPRVTNTATKAFLIPYPMRSPVNPILANSASKAFIISNTIGSTVLTNSNPMYANNALKNFFVPNTVGSTVPTEPSPNVTKTIPQTFLVPNQILSQLPTNKKFNVLTPVHNSIIIPSSQMCASPKLNWANTATKAFIIQDPTGSISPTNPNVRNTAPQTLSTPNKIRTRKPRKRKVANTKTMCKAQSDPHCQQITNKSD